MLTTQRFSFLLSGVAALAIAALIVAIDRGGTPPCASAAAACSVGDDALIEGDLNIQSDTAYSLTLSHSITAARTWQWPDVADTFVGLAATQTLTNKTLTSPTIGTSPTAAGATWPDLGTATTIDINGGTVDGTTIGGASAAAGTFTTLNATGGGALTGTWTDLGSITTVDINSGTLAGVTLDGTNTVTADISFNDSVNATFGTGGDADIYYDGTDLIIAPSVVGTGGIKVNDGDVTLHRAESRPNLSLNADRAAPVDGDILGFFNFQGNDDSSAARGYADIYGVSTDVTAASTDGQIVFETRVANSLAPRMQIDAGVTVGSPTGGDLGAGTLNATAVYDDGALLTDYVFDAYFDGAIDLPAYDAAVPAMRRKVRNEATGLVTEIVEPRVHQPAHDFDARKTTLLDIGQLKALIASTRSLPCMPSVADYRAGKRLSLGEQSQCGTEALEILYVLVFQLDQRIASLEGQIATLAAK